jgi:hypothetical protein
MTGPRNGLIASRSPLTIVALALAVGCEGADPRPKTGSETHFLSWCSSSGSCSDGLDCLCGVCTKSCADTASCAGLAAAAECVTAAQRPASHACPGAPIEASCEIACTEDADCASLGATHRCDRGFCRSLGADCQTGQIGGSEVVVLGDAFLGDSHQITAELEALAREAGALGIDERYRDYSTSLITPFGGTADLPTQYATARSDGGARVVIMDVGGPDAWLGSCPEPLLPDCPALASGVAGAGQLWRQMADDRVESVVDLFYPDPADAGLLAKFDVLRPEMQAACAASPVSCRFIDLRPTFEGRASEYLVPGGITPTAAGSVATAATIWSLMQQHCIAQ